MRRDVFNPVLEKTAAPQGRGLLAVDTKPYHYDLAIMPDLEAGDFYGNVAILIDIIKDTDTITINASKHKITSTDVYNLTTKEPLDVHKVNLDHGNDTVEIKLTEQIASGSKIRLFHEFRRHLNITGSMAGFYRTSWSDADGKSHWIGSTMFQPTGAREAFPCFDEPSAKATFGVTLIVPEELTCLSNMDIKTVTPSFYKGKKTVLFNKSPPMSTYLVAFVVGQFNSIENNDFRVPVRCWATPDNPIEGCKFAAEVGALALRQHEETFEIPYPLPKMDMVAVPGHSGAMENWGCIIYDPNRLVLDELDTSVLTRQSAAHTITHELAHQWFGNIVTMDWWDSIWLNESFADWATLHALTQMFPAWNMWNDFVAGYPGQDHQNGYQEALRLDSNRASHPVEVPVDTPSQIAQVFDPITYAKGCTVLRMLAEFIGIDMFIAGVREHLKAHAFGNASTTDFWQTMNKASGQDVEKLMRTWTQAPGYPLIAVTENSEEGTITVTQHRFLQNGGPSLNSSLLQLCDQSLKPPSIIRNIPGF